MKQSPSPFPLLGQKEDQDLQEFIPQQQATSSLSCPLFYNFFTQDQRDGDHPTKDQHQQKVDEYSLQERSSDGDESKGSMKWIMSSNNKMRIMNSSCSTSENNKRAQKTMVNEEEEKDKYTSKVVNYYSSSAGLRANDCTVRVCADCNTTKTPLWRSGPRGPKSLCNACGIRQRKAKRAAMAAIENGTTDAPKSPKSPKKEKKLRTSHAKNLKKQKRLSFEEFNLSLISKKSGFRQVFPQDEEEAAILLMALSCGLIDHS